MPQSKKLRLSLQTLIVLGQIIACRGEIAGSEIRRQTELQPGTLYPILHRLKDHGLLISRGEEGDKHHLQRPLKTYYALTEDGHKFAQELLGENSSLLRAFSLDRNKEKTTGIDIG